MIPNYEKITEFWCEVVSTIEALLQETDESRAHGLLNHYEKQLKRIDGNLTFHFERNESNNRIEMIIGCDGYAQSIAAVLSLVDAAPLMDGVQVIAFNNRHDPLPECIRVGDDDYAIEQFWFSHRLEAGEFHLSIYLDELDTMDGNPAVEAVMIYLDALLGEFDLMTRVATLCWYDKPQDPLDYGLRPLSDVRDLFDSLRDQIRLIGVTLH
ncbi:hypothetical protein DV711_01055 [Motiliproteus coralliicola]|uniref:Uncharacterized protein n=1 Tax=Motiliproteus coralliicola TaxID=2283196 RepID=A0A369WQ50_9GAMM|nr:hypothetical protein [Motiliproteus coralliicola]RDE24218.1 hypothetical protein DV711_01055 [Motiliproteus coralliicola]